MNAMDGSPMRVLVTGSARGIGRALALRLGARGHEVMVHYRSSRTEAAQTVAEIHRSGGKAHLVSGDVTRPPEVDAMGGAVRERMGGLDALINNVGGFLAKDLDDLTPEEWEYQIASTVSATWYVSKAVLPMLRESGGRIVNFSDSGADRIEAQPRFVPYYVGKTGILILTRTMAVTEAPHGVSVNAVMPGIIENSDPLPPPREVPAGRHGSFDDVGAAVDFLLAPEAGYLTGSFLQVGGGYNL